MTFCEQVEARYQDISPHIRDTPLVRSLYLSSSLQCELLLKLENMQVAGAFKARGAISKLISLSPEERARGLVTGSAGNHGLGVCYAAQIFGCQARVYLPTGTPEYKVQRVAELGGEAILHGATWDDANAAAERCGVEEGMTYVHAFSDEEVIRGQATIALEILAQVSDPDVIVCPIGGGGLIAGVGAYAKGKNARIRVVGVETEGTASMKRSLDAGSVVPLKEVRSVAKSIAVKEVTPRTLSYAQGYVDEVYTVTDGEAMDALIEILQRERQLTEPASSAALAAVLTDKIPNIRHKKVVVVLSGGNYSVEALGSYLASKS